MKPLSITAFGIVTAAGQGSADILSALKADKSGLCPADFPGCDLDTWIGIVPEVENNPITGRLSDFDCRNNRLAKLALETDGFASSVDDAAKRYGLSRIGIVLGTSTSGVGAAEEAYRNRDLDSNTLPDNFHYRQTHHVHSAVDYVRQYLDIGGVGLMVSTACSSSAKVFASGYRLIAGGVCDAVVVGGVDSLCLTTLYGFSSLELVSEKPCMPWSPHRAGLSLGEAAGFALLERPESVSSGTGVQLLGYGESSDAYHMSSPHPDGIGAADAMRRAVSSASLCIEEIDYINLHGTATLANDSMEDKAILRVFGGDTPCSSTKGWTGHTLGAAGITEAFISTLCIQNDFVPGTLNTIEVDSNLGAGVQLESTQQPVQRVLSNSFGFGGSNCSLIFGSCR